MASYPVLTRAGMRNKVRELSGIYATDVFSDSLINEFLNEELYSIQTLFDDLSVYWNSGQTGFAYGYKVPYFGVDYRFPGWRWDNYTKFPTGAKNDLYLESDADVAPWDKGHYDNILVYRVVERILTQQADDTGRAAVYKEKADTLKAELVAREYVNWNRVLLSVYQFGPDTSSTFDTITLRLGFQVFLLLGEFENVEWEGAEVSRRIVNERDELYAKFNWFFENTWEGWGYDVVELFAYGVASRMAAERGLSEQLVSSLRGEFESRVEKHKRNILYNVTVGMDPGELYAIAHQTRALLQDFSKDMPDTVLFSWINEAYQTLALEREWQWLEQELSVELLAGEQAFGLSMGNAVRILNMFVVESGNSSIDNQESAVVYPVAHKLDSNANSSKFTYDVDTSGVVTILPAPDTARVFKLRYVTQPAVLGFGDTVLFDSRFANILAYRAAMKAILFNPQGKQLLQVYADQEAKLFEAMMSYYQLSRSSEPFQLGVNGLEEGKYIPYFRTN